MTLLFEGIALGMLLFVISVGLSVTMGLMHLINLAHGVFAMVGGYLAVLFISQYQINFFLSLVLIIAAVIILGMLLEILLFRRIYKASEMDQVLLTIALIYIAGAGAMYLFGPGHKTIQLPDFLLTRYIVLGVSVDMYRVFIIAIGIVALVALQWSIIVTSFGAKLRASVENQEVARAMGINVDRIYSITFAIGCGLAGVGGALGVPLLGLNPQFAIMYLILFFIVVSVGGPGSIIGSFIAALVLGITDVVGKYYIPQFGAFFIYAIMVIVLVIRPQGFLGRDYNG